MCHYLESIVLPLSWLDLNWGLQLPNPPGDIWTGSIFRAELISVGIQD